METDDAFGEATSLAWRKGGIPGVAWEVIERDDGFLSVNDVAKYFASFAAWPYLEQEACRRADGRILDVGCGPGRHALWLRDQGKEVLGIDVSSGAIAVARARGVDAMELPVAAVDPATVGLFDTILLGGQNIGLLAGPSEGPAVLTRLASVTLPGGRLLGVGMDPYKLEHPAHIAYRKWNQDHGRMPGQQRFRIREGITASPWFDYLFATPTELEKLAASTPWSLDDTIVEGPQYLAAFVRNDE